MIVETCNMLVARQQVVHLWETMDETLIWSRLAKNVPSSVMRCVRKLLIRNLWEISFRIGIPWMSFLII